MVIHGKTVKLMNDIDINEGKYNVDQKTGQVTFTSDAQTWYDFLNVSGSGSPCIGDVVSSNENGTFRGTFDGQNHTISGIYSPSGSRKCIIWSN